MNLQPSEPRKRRIKPYDAARDSIVFALAIWAALCLLSQKGTPAERVAACCTNAPISPAEISAVSP